METAITLSGMLGADPEVQTTARSVKARFRVAVTRRELRDGRWCDVETTWMQVEAWNLLARNVATSLRKGDPVVVSGLLRTSRWVDERGTRHDRIHVTAQHVGHDLALGRSVFQRASRGDEQETTADIPAPADQASVDQGVGDHGVGDEASDDQGVGEATREDARAA